MSFSAEMCNRSRQTHVTMACNTRLNIVTRGGHAVRLIPPDYVRPYVKAQKNDDRDAEPIAEAATRPTMRFVPLKTEDQLDI
jgi:transposase